MLVSIVIPTHNRARTLLRTLEALAAQTFPKEQMEVVVVANGCRDETVETLSSLKPPFSLLSVVLGLSRAAAARNAGAERASGELLIFLDDDIQASPNLVEEHVRAHLLRRNIATVGYLPPEIGGRSDYLTLGLRLWWENLFSQMRRPGYRHDYRSLLSGNLAITASEFRRVGMFDLGFSCREDYELGVRLLKSAVDIVFLPGAWGWHHTAGDLAAATKRAHHEGLNDVLLARRHPELTLFPGPLSAGPHKLTPRAYRALVRWPAAGRLVSAVCLLLLPLLERHGLRRLWNRVSGGLRTYWYWRGVSDMLSSPRMQSVAAWPEDAGAPDLRPGPASDGSWLTIDLEEGVEAAERALDETRPVGVSLRYRSTPVGDIPAVPGAERLRGAHLRAYLLEKLSEPLATALVMSAITEVERPGRRADENRYEAGKPVPVQ